MKKPVTFRFDADLLERAKRSAEADHRTLTNYVETAILRAVNANQMSTSSEITPDGPLSKESRKPVS